MQHATQTQTAKTTETMQNIWREQKRETDERPVFAALKAASVAIAIGFSIYSGMWTPLFTGWSSPPADSASAGSGTKAEPFGYVDAAKGRAIAQGISAAGYQCSRVTYAAERLTGNTASVKRFKVECGSGDAARFYEVTLDGITTNYYVREIGALD